MLRTSSRRSTVALLAVVAQVTTLLFVALPALQRQALPAASASASALGVQLTGPQEVMPGQTAQYGLTVRNYTSSTMQGITAGVGMPSLFSAFVSGQSTPGMTLQNGSVRSAAFSLGGNQARTFQITFQVPSNAQIGQSARFEGFAMLAGESVGTPLDVRVIERPYRGTATATFSGGTMVTHTTDPQGNNSIDVWQQQQNMPGTVGWQIGTIRPTATTVVNNNINAASTNNVNANGCGDTNITPTANTGVDNTVNAASVSRMSLWQQQQNAPGAFGFQVANVYPTATTIVNNNINAASQNNVNAAGQGCGGTSTVNPTANTGVNNKINASATTYSDVWQQQQGPGWSTANVYPVANTWVNNAINAGALNSANLWWR